MTITAEFPDFDMATLPTIPAGFVDTSWHNDTCPSFENETLRLKIWIEYADPDNREMGPDAERFTLCTMDGDGALEDIIRTNDWSDILALIARGTI